MHALRMPNSQKFNDIPPYTDRTRIDTDVLLLLLYFITVAVAVCSQTKSSSLFTCSES